MFFFFVVILVLVLIFLLGFGLDLVWVSFVDDVVDVVGCVVKCLFIGI